MKNTDNMRKWATPLTIGAFILTGVTGIMMLLKIHSGMVKVVHEWLSLLLVIGTIFHVVANWRIFVNYFSNFKATVIIGIFILVTLVTMIPLGNDQKGIPGFKVSEMLIRFPVSSLAEAAGHSTDEVSAIMNAEGITIERNDQSIGEIAQKNGRTPSQILDMIF
jgi:hypothetical protein